MRFKSVSCWFILSAVAMAASPRLNPESQPRRSWADQTLESMTLEQKISQMFCGSAYGFHKAVDHPDHLKVLDLVERFQIGGLMLHQGTPLSQLFLINRLQQETKVPLWFSQDLEWGAGMRVHDSTTFPSMMALGATRDPKLAYAVARVIAQEVRALGVHQAYAPVADVNNNPLNPIINVRSFGETPQLVTQMAVAYARGLQDGGVIATAKHFPGHGDTAVDSHLTLPILSHDLDRLNAVELFPFHKLIDAGVGSVMVGHLAIPALEADPQVPATLSPKIVASLLRKKMGFEGLIVTDAMSMKGITNHFEPGEACVRAIEAGCDVLLMSRDPYLARRAIIRAVKSGRIEESRINSSVARILGLKEAADLHRRPLRQPDLVTRLVANQPHLVLSQEIGRRSITLLRNEGGILPVVTPNPRILCVVMSDTDDPKLDAFLRKRIKELIHPAQFQVRLLDRRSHRDEFTETLNLSNSFDLVLLPCFFKVRARSTEMSFSQSQRDFFDMLVQGRVPTIVISLGSPYLTIGLHQPTAHLACFSDCEASQSAAVHALFGYANLQGKCPVTIPGVNTFGDGIELDQVRLRPGHPLDAGMAATLSEQVDRLIESAIADRIFPGAAVAVGRAGVLVHNQGYGTLTYESERAVTPDSKFDLASLTKAVATTTAVMHLFDQGRLYLGDRVAKFLPRFAQNGKHDVTLLHLLTHTSGLAAYYPFHTMDLTDRDSIIDFIMAEELQYPPGTDCVYSDLGMITLGLVAEHVAGTDLEAYLKEHFWKRLDMHHTEFRAIGKKPFDPLIVPTEIDETFRRRLIHGEVHDETAYSLGGIAGHAGLFSTSTDLAQFAYLLLNGGTSHRFTFLKQETIQRFAARATDIEGCTRALGWDTKTVNGYSSAGKHFGPKSFGHTGFTGTSMWLDPDQKLFVILLTNRVHPSRTETRHKEIRAKLADIAFQAITGPPMLDLSPYDKP